MHTTNPEAVKSAVLGVVIFVVALVSGASLVEAELAYIAVAGTAYAVMPYGRH